MEIKRIIALLIASIVFNSTLIAQEKQTQTNGKPIIQIFGDFYAGFGEEKEELGFELNRAYLGYQYELKKGLSINAVMDIGESKQVNDYQRIAYIKNAQISWKRNNLTLNAGLISTTQFNEIEKFWGKRYVAKSFQDEYKFGHSADLGLSVAYKFGEIISIDAIITNGEGYKKLQQNNSFQYGLGATINPIKNLYFRLYGGINDENQANFSFFTGYKSEKITLGAEYNILKDQKQGASFFGNFSINKNFDFYARYDILEEEILLTTQDNSSVIAGFEYRINDNIKISPNFKASIPRDNNLNTKYSAFISCYFGI